MSAQNFEPRFDEGQTYSRDEFIFRVECLLQTNQDQSEVASTLQSWLNWAKAHQAETVISWRRDTDDVIHPTVTIGQIDIPINEPSIAPSNGVLQ